AGTRGLHQAYLERFLAYSTVSLLGLEVAFSFDVQTERIRIEAQPIIADYERLFRVEYDYGEKALYCYDNVLHDVPFATGIDLYGLLQTWHVMKLVIDLATRKYVRFILDDVVYDLSDYTSSEGAVILTPMIRVILMNTGRSGENDVVYFDDFIMTQNELA
ncbi:unnamed protein product, partial [marine sediment metagenome]